MRLAYLTHRAFFRHEAGREHPERPARLEAVERGLHASRAELVVVEPAEVDLDLLHRVHTAEFVRSIEAFCMAGGGYLDADTYAGELSWEAALRAAGSGPAAVEHLDADQADAAFCAVRPPGHHAEPARAMGFCLFNNAAVTAQMLADRGDRVAIVDWDVHHGNGTQEMFNEDPNILYISLHQFPMYPGTGWVDEVGITRGRGSVLNVPFPSGTAGDAYRDTVDELIGPVLGGFSPDWLLISAGYDAHAADPLATLQLLPSDYGYMAASFRETVQPRRTILFLEGGYDLDAIEQSVRATVAGLAGHPPPPEAQRPTSPERAWQVLSLVKESARPFHKLP